MSEWQPIETAPKDGSDILVWDDFEISITFWGKTAHVPIYGWIQVDFGDLYDLEPMEPQPTHWMPLPEPPEG